MTGSDTMRLDKWLWHARFCRNRALAARLCAGGRVRVDGARTVKAHHAVRIGTVLTFPHMDRIRVVRVVALGTRRGPATESRTLYEDLLDAPPVPRPSAFVAAFGAPRTRDLR